MREIYIGGKSLEKKIFAGHTPFEIEETKDFMKRWRGRRKRLKKKNKAKTRGEKTP